ncbi:MAG: bacterial Ig-like domain-containing protein [Clostridiales bacterium]|nr:bacterial Ig-like domain-containing protein [Clostridiales bacterium]
MKRTVNKVIAIMLAVVMTFGAAPAAAFLGLTASAESASGTCGANLNWTLDTETGVLSVTGTGPMADFSEVDPAPWSSSKDAIIGVIFEAGVTGIGFNAFSGYSNLKDAMIPDSVESIADDAFADCDGLKIWGKDSSKAQTYSTEKGIEFVSYDDITSIKADPAPTAKQYLGEAPDLTGLVVKAVKADESEVTVPSFGYSVAPEKFKEKGAQKVTLTLVGDDTLTTDIDVSVYDVVSITVTAPPAKTEYYTGDTLNTAGLVFKVTYEDGNVIQYKTDGFNVASPENGLLDKAGNTVVKINYYGAESYFGVTVTDPKVTNVKIETPADTKAYFVGDDIDTTGLTLAVTYENGKTVIIDNGFTCEPTTFDEAGTKTVKVKFGEKEARYDVTVEEVKLVSWVISKKPDKKSYFYGEEIDTTGLEITEYYNNGKTETVTEGFTCDPAAFEEIGVVETERIITVTYKGSTDTFVVKVGPVHKYFAEFVADETTVDTVTFTVNDGVVSNITEPEVPAKEGYTGAWEDYTLTANNITIKAVYTPIKYTATFIADEETVKTVEYDVTTESIKDEEPKVPAKEGYTYAWEEYTLKLENITITAVYTPIEYTATFKADGNTVGTVKFTVEDTDLSEPEVPAKEGYTGEWETYTIKAENLTINAVYETIEYTATFKADGDIVGTVKYTVETPSIKDKEPAVTEKEGFTGKWEKYTLEAEDITINAIYTPIEYFASFYAKDQLVDRIPYTLVGDNADTLESLMARAPEVPEFDGYYNGRWNTDGVVLSKDGVRINAEYDAVPYKVTFVVDGKPFKIIQFTLDNNNIEAPAVPEKLGYTAEWESYTLDKAEDVTVNAVYKPNTYYAVFKADGTVIGRVPYTFDDESIEEPVVPNKEDQGYSGAWEEYDLKTVDGIIVNAVYTPIEYKAVFVGMDGTKVGEVPYTVETISIKRFEPNVPVMEDKGYKDGKWEEYDLTTVGGLTVKPVYTPIEYAAVFVDADGKEVGRVPYTVETESIKDQEPQVPSREDKGYKDGKWADYELKIGGTTVNATYTPIEYKAKFVNEKGTEVGSVSYTVETESITEPAVPAKAGYDGKWAKYDLKTVGGLTVKPVYTATEYSGKFVDYKGKTLKAFTYTVETESIEDIEPAVPARKGYKSGAKWSYTMPLPVGGTTIYAAYTPAEYTVTFIATGKGVEKLEQEVKFTVESEEEAPFLSAHKGYTAEWPEDWFENFVDDPGDTTVYAVVTPITYTYTFVHFGEVIKTVEYTVETTYINKPAVPSSPGFGTGYRGVWEDFAFPPAALRNYTVKSVAERIVPKIDIPYDSITVRYKAEADIGLNISNANGAAGYKIVWSSSDQSVATVDENGHVKAIYKGSKTAVITASLIDTTTSKTVQTETCKVNVKLVWWQFIIIFLLMGWMWY